MMDGLSRSEMISLILRLALVGSITVLTTHYLIDALDPTSRQKKKAHKKAQELLQKCGVTEHAKLSEYEHIIASQLVLSTNMRTGWRDIAGLQPIIRELYETVILPIQQSKMHKSSLIKPPKGVLLHGPPGCGKTLLARAVAREAGCRFINLDVSILTDKWYGESQKLAAAVFSLATKIQPCIIFIDEVDSFLKIRSTADHEATAMMKAMFLQQWDGLNTDHEAHVVVMAATNRPSDVDRAILRRLPAAFHIQLPEQKEREEILHLVLKDEKVAPCVNLSKIAAATTSFSGSELRELCRNAAVYAFRSSYQKEELPDSSSFSDSLLQEVAVPEELRPITHKDLEKALCVMRASRVLDLSANELKKIDLD